MKLLEKIQTVWRKSGVLKFTSSKEKLCGQTAKIIPLYPRTKKGKIIFF